MSAGYRIVLAENRLSAEQPWSHLSLTMTDAPFDWLHVHDAVELGICLSGRGVWVAGDRRLPFSAGSALVIAPGIPHFAHCQPGTTSRWEFLMVDPSLILHGHQQGREALDPRSLAGDSFPIMLDARRHAEAWVLVREAVLEAGRASPDRDAVVRALCWAALARSRRLAGPTTRATDAGMLGSLRPALERMASPDQPPPAMTELAALCRLSQATLLRRFRRALGMSTKAWLDRNRILRAAERLRDPRMGVLRVALDSGFSSTSGFNRQFRAILGMSPRAWRDRVLSKSARS